MKKRTKKIVLGVLAVVFLLGLAITIFVNFKLEDFVRNKLEKNLDSSWQIEFAQIDFSILSMEFDVKQIDISRTDSTGIMWSVSLEKANISGLHPFQVLLSNELKIDELFLHEPVAKIQRLKSGNKVSKQTSPNKISLIIDNTILDNGKVIYEDENFGYLRSLVNLEINNIRLGDEPIQTLEIIDASVLNLEQLKFTNADSTEFIAIDKISKKKHEPFILDSLNWVPELKLKKYSEFYGWRKSLTSMKIHQILAEMPFLDEDSAYNVPLIKISGVDVDLEKDLTYSLPDRRTSLPQELLEKSGFLFKLDSAVLDNGSFAIELHRKNGSIARLNFDQINGVARVQNVHKDSTAFGFSAQASTLNGSSLQVSTEYRFGRQNPWSLSGSLTDTDLEFLSDFLRKMAGIEIASGKLNKLNFEMEGNNQINEGTVTFLYDNLDIRAVDKETGKKKVVLNILTDVLGALVFWKQNPSNENTRYGEFSVKRDPRRAFPSQWIEGLMAGILETVSKVDPMKIKSEEDKKKKE